MIIHMLNKKEITNDKLILYGLFVIDFLPSMLIVAIFLNLLNIVFWDLSGNEIAYLIQWSLIGIVLLFFWISRIKTVWRNRAFRKTNDLYGLYEKAIDYNLIKNNIYSDWAQLGELQTKKEKTERLILKKTFLNDISDKNHSWKRIVWYAKSISLFVILSSLLWISVVCFSAASDKWTDIMRFLVVVLAWRLVMWIYRYVYWTVFVLSQEGLDHKSHWLVWRGDIKNISVEELIWFKWVKNYHFWYIYNNEDFDINLGGLDIWPMELKRLIKWYKKS